MKDQYKLQRDNWRFYLSEAAGHFPNLAKALLGCQETPQPHTAIITESVRYMEWGSGCIFSSVYDSVVSEGTELQQRDVQDQRFIRETDFNLYFQSLFFSEEGRFRLIYKWLCTANILNVPLFTYLVICSYCSGNSKDKLLHPTRTVQMTHIYKQKTHRTICM